MASTNIKKNDKSTGAWLLQMMGQKTFGKVDQIPEGWMTLPQMAAVADLAMTTMGSRVNRMLHAGLIQRKKFRIDTGRHITEVWHYYKK